MSEAPRADSRDETQANWLARHTTLEETATALLDEPTTGLSAWLRTTTGVVALLLSLQILTGLLLAFYYVPTSTDAHQTVAFIEKAVESGSWLRALHYYCSQLLPLALLLHLAQMLWREAYRRQPVGWVASIILLALVLANGATGYSLPWDARAFYGTRVASGIAGGLPLVGEAAKSWLLGGAEISTLTLSRLFALHVVLVPLLIALLVVLRLFVARERRPFPLSSEAARKRDFLRLQLMRNALVVALVFLALALFAAKYPAPLGPPAEEAEAGYLPRPGPQFLWLFQMLKYLPPALASLAAVFVPGLLLASLASLPFLSRGESHRARRAGTAVLSVASLMIATLTAIAYLEDSRNPRVREQLARQVQQEKSFRQAPFAPRPMPSATRASATDASGSASPGSGATTQTLNPPPPAYTQSCAKCHGERGEGKSVNPPLIGISAQPQRTVQDLVAIMNNPRSYNLEPRMPSFAGKLSEDEKLAIAEWIASLR